MQTPLLSAHNLCHLPPCVSNPRGQMDRCHSNWHSVLLHSPLTHAPPLTLTSCFRTPFAYSFSLSDLLHNRNETSHTQAIKAFGGNGNTNVQSYVHTVQLNIRLFTRLLSGAPVQVPEWMVRQQKEDAAKAERNAEVRTGEQRVLRSCWKGRGHEVCVGPAC